MNGYMLLLYLIYLGKFPMLKLSKKEYADDWYCRNCEYGPLNESDDKCPRCNTKWNEDMEITVKYFKKGDLVRLTSAACLSNTKDEEKEIVGVLEDSDKSTGSTLVQLFALNNDEENRHLDVNRFNTEDLELATITTAKQLKRQFYFWGKT